MNPTNIKAEEKCDCCGWDDEGHCCEPTCSTRRAKKHNKYVEPENISLGNKVKRRTELAHDTDPNWTPSSIFKFSP